MEALLGREARLRRRLILKAKRSKDPQESYEHLWSVARSSGVSSHHPHQSYSGNSTGGAASSVTRSSGFSCHQPPQSYSGNSTGGTASSIARSSSFGFHLPPQSYSGNSTGGAASSVARSSGFSTEHPLPSYSGNSTGGAASKQICIFCNQNIPWISKGVILHHDNNKNTVRSHQVHGAVIRHEPEKSIKAQSREDRMNRSDNNKNLVRSHQVQGGAVRHEPEESIKAQSREARMNIGDDNRNPVRSHQVHGGVTHHEPEQSIKDQSREARMNRRDNNKNPVRSQVHVGVIRHEPEKSIKAQSQEARMNRRDILSSKRFRGGPLSTKYREISVGAPEKNYPLTCIGGSASTYATGRRTISPGLLQSQNVHENNVKNISTVNAYFSESNRTSAIRNTRSSTVANNGQSKKRSASALQPVEFTITNVFPPKHGANQVVVKNEPDVPPGFPPKLNTVNSESCRTNTLQQPVNIKTEPDLDVPAVILRACSNHHSNAGRLPEPDVPPGFPPKQETAEKSLHSSEATFQLCNNSHGTDALRSKPPGTLGEQIMQHGAAGDASAERVHESVSEELKKIALSFQLPCSVDLNAHVSRLDRFITNLRKAPKRMA